MKTRFMKRLRFAAAGSLGAAVIALGFVPFNMGGCQSVSVGGYDVSGIVGGGQQFLKGFFEGPEIEPALGQAVAVQATSRTPLYRDEKLTRYVTLVGRTVAASSKEPGYKYYFAILDTDTVNAASGPHGYIMITRGALTRMHDESELAGVLGHEIGHVSLHHGQHPRELCRATWRQAHLKSRASGHKRACGAVWQCIRCPGQYHLERRFLRG